jgi:integrase
MGRKRVPGLIMRAGIWHIDKRLFGRRVCQSTGTAQLQEAERMLARVMEEARQTQIYGVRPSRTFEQAAAKFVLENQRKRSIRDDVNRLKGLMPWIGSAALDKLHRGSLQPWVEGMLKRGAAIGTVNHYLQIVRRILNLAASEWTDEHGLTWLFAAPKIKLMANYNKRPPYPLSWEEQSRLFQELPDYSAQMALFAVNTGCRDQEVCQLRWEWEVEIPQLRTFVFIIPRTRVKNGEERLVVLNRMARSVVNARRGMHPDWVFAHNDRALTTMLNRSWRAARAKANLSNVRVHDLKHTYGRRLRAAGVSFEDRQDLLGHRSGRITTHYSAAELTRLIEAAESVVERDEQRSELVVLRGSVLRDSRISPAKGLLSAVRSA